MSAEKTNDIENRFAYHKPTDEKIVLHESIRGQVKTLAHYWSGNLPAGRESALALTKLEEAMFWANAASARNP
jgi:hypothetical protein